MRVVVLLLVVLVLGGCKKSKHREKAKSLPCPESNMVSSKPTTPIEGEYIYQLDLKQLPIELLNDQTYEQQITQLGNVLNSMLANAGIEAVIKHVFVASIVGFSAEITASNHQQLITLLPIGDYEPVRSISVFQDCATEPSEEKGTQQVSYGARKVGTKSGQGKRAWIIDTGIDLDHPDLNVNGTLSKNFVDNLILGLGNQTPEDLNGHGTHVAGIVGAKNNDFGTVGIASGAELVAVKVLNQLGDGSTSSVIQGIDYVASAGKKGEVANLSLGGSPSNALDRAVEQLAMKGIAVAIAAGNEGGDAAKYSPGRVNAPGVYTVSAIDEQNVYALFSNFGNPPIDFAEPGVNILSTYLDGKYQTLSGTSMAAPHLAGILLHNGNNIPTNGVALNDPDDNPDPIGVLR